MLALLPLLLAAAPLKLAAPTFAAINVPAPDADAYTEHFARSLAHQHLDVLPRPGTCDTEDLTCATLTGSIGRFENTFQIRIEVVDSRRTVLALFATTTDSEAEVKGELERGAGDIAMQLNPRTGARPNLLPWVGATGGGVLIITGLGLLIAAQARVTALIQMSTSSVGSNPRAYADGATAMRTIGIAFISIGAITALTSTLWGMLRSTEPAPVAFFATPNEGAFVAWSGRLP